MKERENGQKTSEKNSFERKWHKLAQQNESHNINEQDDSFSSNSISLVRFTFSHW